MADLVGPENAVTRQPLEKLPAEHARRADDEDRFQVSVWLTKTDDVTIGYAEFGGGRSPASADGAMGTSERWVPTC